LAKNFNCKVTGITLSPVQVKMATKASSTLKIKPRFMIMDAQNINLKEKFDVIWAVEVISHLNNKKQFFEKYN